MNEELRREIAETIMEGVREYSNYLQVADKIISLLPTPKETMSEEEIEEIVGRELDKWVPCGENKLNLMLGKDLRDGATKNIVKALSSKIAKQEPPKDKGKITNLRKVDYYNNAELRDKLIEVIDRLNGGEV